MYQPTMTNDERCPNVSVGIRCTGKRGHPGACAGVMGTSLINDPAPGGSPWRDWSDAMQVPIAERDQWADKAIEHVRKGESFVQMATGDMVMRAMLDEFGNIEVQDLRPFRTRWAMMLPEKA